MRVYRSCISGVNPGGEAGTRPPQISDARDAHVKFPIASPPNFEKLAKKGHQIFHERSKKNGHQIFQEGKKFFFENFLSLVPPKFEKDLRHCLKATTYPTCL